MRCCRWRIAYAPPGPTRTARIWPRHSWPARWSVIVCRPSRISPTNDRAKAAALATEPLVDNLGSPVGQNLADAAALVDAIVQRVESHVSTVETRSATEVAVGHSRRRRSHGRRAAGRPTRQPHQQGRATARRSRRPPRSAGGCQACIRTAQRTRTSRRRATSTVRDVDDARPTPRRARRSRDLGASVGGTMPRARSRRRPTLAVPSVAAVGPFSPIDELKAMPWTAARAVMAPVVAKVETTGSSACPRLVDGSSNRSTTATTCADCCRRFAARPLPGTG